jgi:hypothetical protein
MGKRELLIAVIFLVVGVAAYHLTAPATTGERGFSLSRFFSQTRQKIQSDRAQASFTQNGTLTVGSGVNELRVSQATRMLTVVGEQRQDVAYELVVDSTGPDEATALSYAKRTALTVDDLGAALALAIEYPKGGSQTSQLTLHVPSRLTVRVEGTSSTHVAVSHVAGVRLGNILGETELSAISGPVTGQVRGGTFDLDGAESVTLTMQGTMATLANVAQKNSLTLRAGRCTVRGGTGPVDVDATNTDLTLEATASAHVSASAGRIALRAPQKLIEIDGRRTRVDVTLAGPAPVTVITTEEPIHLSFASAIPAIVLDAASSDGVSIDAGDSRLETTTENRTTKLTHAFGPASAPRVVLRNSRGPIVIMMTK